MKMNKKLLVPFFSTIIGLSIAGGLGGAFAWYQFNSQVRSSFIGTSVADTGVLQIGYMDGNEIKWGRDHLIPNAKLVPATFGSLKADGSLKETAYGYPEASGQFGTDYTSGWLALANQKGYYQYDVYLRALKADSASSGDASQGIKPGYKLVAQDVYMSSLTLEDSREEQDDKLITDAIRVHLDVDGGRKTLISKTAVSNLELYGELDLDADGVSDTYDDPFDALPARTITYGIDGEKQTTLGKSDIVQPRDSEGKMPSTPNEKLICKTKTGTEMAKITITIWLEGWALLKTTSTGSATSNIWNPSLSAGVNVHVGMVFDAGRNIIG